MPSPGEPPAAPGTARLSFICCDARRDSDVTVGVLGDHRGVEVVRYLDRSSVGSLAGKHGSLRNWESSVTFRFLHRGLDVIPERDRHIRSGAYDSAEPGYRGDHQ